MGIVRLWWQRGQAAKEQEKLILRSHRWTMARAGWMRVTLSVRGDVSIVHVYIFVPVAPTRRHVTVRIETDSIRDVAARNDSAAVRVEIETIAAARCHGTM
jgi:hypothetical protein